MSRGVSYWRMIWPENGPLLAGVGGVIGLLSDVGGFLGGVVPPWVWAPMAAGLLVAAASFRPCRARVQADLPQRQDNAYECRICNLFRVGLYACLVCAALALAGQGATATENIGTKLGLIEKKVDDIKQDTGVIREDVGIVREALSANEPVKNPQTAGEWFHNAWVYTHARRDEAKAWQALQELYARFAPNKLDAAELYRSTGAMQLGGNEISRQMIEIGRKQRDAAMLVIAARNEAAPEAAFALYDEARQIDPDQPFAYWDVGNTQLLFWGTTRSTSLGDTGPIREEIANLERFLEVAGRGPLARYYFMPRYQGDYEQVARQTMESKRRLLGVTGQSRKTMDAAHARMKKARTGG